MVYEVEMSKYITDRKKWSNLIHFMNGSMIEPSLCSIKKACMALIRVSCKGFFFVIDFFSQHFSMQNQYICLPEHLLLGVLVKQ